MPKRRRAFFVGLMTLIAVIQPSNQVPNWPNNGKWDEKGNWRQTQAPALASETPLFVADADDTFTSEVSDVDEMSTAAAAAESAENPTSSSQPLSSSETETSSDVFTTSGFSDSTTPAYKINSRSRSTVAQKSSAATSAESSSDSTTSAYRIDFRSRSTVTQESSTVTSAEISHRTGDRGIGSQSSTTSAKPDFSVTSSSHSTFSPSEGQTVAMLANSVTTKVKDLTSRPSTTVTTTANSVVSSSKFTYTATCRLKNMNFNAAMTDVTSPTYIETYRIVYPIMDKAFADSLGSSYLGLTNISFTSGSVVVSSQLALGSPLTDAMLNRSSSSLVQSFASSGYQADGLSFLMNTLPTSAPGVVSGVDFALMIGIVAGLLVVVTISVTALSVLVCRRRCRGRSNKSDATSSVGSPSVSSSSSSSRNDLVPIDRQRRQQREVGKRRPNMMENGDLFRPYGLPPTRKATLFWKGNKTAMNEASGEFEFDRPDRQSNIEEDSSLSYPTAVNNSQNPTERESRRRARRPSAGVSIDRPSRGHKRRDDRHRRRAERDRSSSRYDASEGFSSDGGEMSSSRLPRGGVEKRGKQRPANRKSVKDEQQQQRHDRRQQHRKKNASETESSGWQYVPLEAEQAETQPPWQKANRRPLSEPLRLPRVSNRQSQSFQTDQQMSAAIVHDVDDDDSIDDDRFHDNPPTRGLERGIGPVVPSTSYVHARRGPPASAMAAGFIGHAGMPQSAVAVTGGGQMPVFPARSRPIARPLTGPGYYQDNALGPLYYGAYGPGAGVGAAVYGRPPAAIRPPPRYNGFLPNAY